MKLKDYLEKISGLCIFSSADRSGKVTTAIYSAPRVMEDGSVCFIMRERLTYRNMKDPKIPRQHACTSNTGGGYQGIRLFLAKVREDNDPS